MFSNRIRKRLMFDLFYWKTLKQGKPVEINSQNKISSSAWRLKQRPIHKLQVSKKKKKKKGIKRD